jgi:hypothetical protein
MKSLFALLVNGTSGSATRRRQQHRRVALSLSLLLAARRPLPVALFRASATGAHCNEVGERRALIVLCVLNVFRFLSLRGVRFRLRLSLRLLLYTNKTHGRSLE